MEGYLSYNMDDFWLKVFLPFFANLPNAIKSSMTSTSLTELENWWSQTPNRQMNQDTCTQMEQILATTKQQLAEVTLGFFQELPFVGSWVDE